MKIKYLLFLEIFVFLLVGCTKHTITNPNEGTFIDTRDQHKYNTVKIGDQTWLAENLVWLPAVSPFVEGSKTDPHYYVYGYAGQSVDTAKSTKNYASYGVLYNWAAALTACPAGWHLPSDEEWKILETHLGMSQDDAYAEGWRDSGAIGTVLKTTAGWSNDGSGSNTAGFAAHPGGYRHDDGGFSYLGDIASFWSSTQTADSLVWNRYLSHYDDGVYRIVYEQSYGFSVRCLQD